MAEQIQYGLISWSNYLNLASVAIRLPFALIAKAVYSPFTQAGTYTNRPSKRRITDTVLRFVTTSLSVPEGQWVAGTGLSVYTRWTKAFKLDTIIDKLDSKFQVGGNGSRGGELLWIGPKRTDKVILYFPGGAFHFQVQDLILKFWRYAQLHWEKQGIQVGIAVLSYSVLPGAIFPTQLQQATRAVEYLISIGCEPSTIQLAGDSAGGNLALQVLSHILHPLPSIDPLILPPNTRLRGALLLSPWVSPSKADSMKSHDVISSSKLEGFGRDFLSHVPASQMMYAEPALAPDGWFEGLNNVVDHILVTAGTEECLFNQIVMFYEKKISHCHDNAVMEMQEGGLHVDVVLDFLGFNAPIENKLTPPVILEWIAKGCMY